MESNRRRNRGRPRSETAGAREAFEVIKRYLERNKLTLNELAIHSSLTASSVTRALSNKDTARWTPTFKILYSIAKNHDIGIKLSPAMKRLAAYEGPGEIEVKRLLDNVEALITSLSTSGR
jgi:transcriptional regulator with XRE-family HTH domain